MSERIAVYPGSFDPPTLGHLDLIRRAARLFDRLIVAVAVNEAKAGLFSTEERCDMLRTMVHDLPGVEVTQFHGLTVEFAHQVGAVALVRGLRVVSDFEFELTMAITNHERGGQGDALLLPPSEPCLFLSSRLVKEIAKFGGDVSHFVTREVEQRLQDKLA